MSIEKVNKMMSFIDGAYLDSSALPVEGVQVTIKAIKTEMVQNPRTFKEEEKKIAYFQELRWGLVLGAKCNRKKLVALVKHDASELIGKKIVIYQDPNVKYRANVVGAIRIK